MHSHLLCSILVTNLISAEIDSVVKKIDGGLYTVNDSQDENYFSNMKRVLDALYAQIYPQEERENIIRGALNSLHEKYRDLKYGEIDYGAVETQFAYFYCYASAHASVVCQRLIDAHTKANLFAKFVGKGSLQVSSLGGGPGNDLLGVLQFMRTCGIGSGLSHCTYDKQEQWRDSWQSLVNTACFSPSLVADFHVLDVSDPNRSREYIDMYQSDLFTMSFLLSEVVSQEGWAKGFFRDLFYRAKSGAVFLFIDNVSAMAAHRWFDQMIAQYNAEVGNSWQAGRINRVLGNDDIAFIIPERKQVHDLKPYYEVLCNQGWGHGGNPRTRVACAYRVYCKQ